MAKNIHSTHSRRYTRIRRTLTCLFLIISTLMLMAIGTFYVGRVGIKILGTQAMMAHYYLKIDSCEDQRDYYQELAYTSCGEARRSMQNQADSMDTAIENYTAKRTALAQSNDPIVAFAAKNQFDLVMVILGIACLVVIAAVWYLVYHRFADLIWTEEKIFNLVVSKIFICLAVLFYALHYVCYRVAIIFGMRPKTRKHVKRHTSNIVPFRKKRVG